MLDTNFTFMVLWDFYVFTVRQGIRNLLDVDNLHFIYGDVILVPPKCATERSLSAFSHTLKGCQV